MTEVVKQVTFDCAHMLTGHPGLCQNLHGHTYRLEVGFRQANDVLDDGIVVDFGEISDLLNNIIAPYDHAFIFNGELSLDSTIPEAGIAAAVNYYKLKYFSFSGRVTAENMATHFFNSIKAQAPMGILVTFVRLWESPTTYAEVHE